MLNELAKKCFESARAKGFDSYTPENADLVIPRDLMLIVAELSEALEALRDGRRAKLEYFLERIPLLKGMNTDAGQICFKNAIKDSFEDELADALIRIMHLCGMLNIDIDKHVELKLQYNATRPVMHGGKKF